LRLLTTAIAATRSECVTLHRLRIVYTSMRVTHTLTRVTHLARVRQSLALAALEAHMARVAECSSSLTPSLPACLSTRSISARWLPTPPPLRPCCCHCRHRRRRHCLWWVRCRKARTRHSRSRSRRSRRRYLLPPHRCRVRCPKSTSRPRSDLARDPPRPRSSSSPPNDSPYDTIQYT